MRYGIQTLKPKPWTQRGEEREEGGAERRRPAPWREAVDTVRMPAMRRRLGSSVAAVGRTQQPSQEEAGRPASSNDAEKKRSRRIFGNLLGHLQKAKKQEEVIQASDKMQARAEIIAKAEQVGREARSRIPDDQTLNPALCIRLWRRAGLACGSRLSRRGSRSGSVSCRRSEASA